MKKTLAFLRSALALLLAFAAAPGAACLRSCSVGAEDLACLRLCAQSHALLSENGALPTLAAADCGVELQAAPLLASVSPVQLEAPTLLTVIAAAQPVAAAGLAYAVPASLRGPPLPHAYLGSQHPQANAPPSYC